MAEFIASFKFLRRWWLRIAAFVALVVAILAGYEGARKGLLALLQDIPAAATAVREWASAPEPVQAPVPIEPAAPPAAIGPAPETKRAEPKAAKKAVANQRKPMPCITNVAGIPDMVGAGDDHVHNFGVLFVGDTACFTLPLSAVGDKRMKFVTWSFWNWSSPTIFVEPTSRVDLTRYAVGDRLKVVGRWHRYVRSEDGRDEIFVIDARITKVD